MKFSDLKDVEFVTATLSELLSWAQKEVEDNLNRKLSPADPVLILLKSYFAVHFQLIEIINDLARQNLLTYARGDVLDHMGNFAGVDRLQASSARTTAKVQLTTARTVPTVILKGTRFQAGDNNYFAIDSDIIFNGGDTDATVTATCLNTGAAGNNYSIGELNQIVDPQPFLKSIINITEPAGGADIESDDDYRERIRLAPEKYSNAGSFGAYEYWTKSFSNLIEDVFIISENPGEVDIYPLLSNGEIPNTQFLSDLKNYLSADNIRPLTDNLFCKAPSIIDYDINLTYYIAQSDSISQGAIINAVNKAVDDFVIWQRSELGRDINQTELYKRVREAGAKRCTIISPIHTPVNFNSVAVADNITINYAGLEHD